MERKTIQEAADEFAAEARGICEAILRTFGVYRFAAWLSSRQRG